MQIAVHLVRIIWSSQAHCDILGLHACLALHIAAPDVPTVTPLLRGTFERTCTPSTAHVRAAALSPRVRVALPAFGAVRALVEIRNTVVWRGVQRDHLIIREFGATPFGPQLLRVFAPFLAHNGDGSRQPLLQRLGDWNERQGETAGARLGLARPRGAVTTTNCLHLVPHKLGINRDG